MLHLDFFGKLPANFDGTDHNLDPKTGPSLHAFLAAQDVPGWTWFWKRYAPYIYRLFSTAGLSMDEADEQTQALIVKWHENGSLANYDPARGEFRGYMFRAISHAIKDWHRRPHQQLSGEQLEVAAEKAAAIEAVVAKGEEAVQGMLVLLRIVLPSLNQADQDLIRMSYFQEEPIRRIAADLGLKYGAVAMRLSRIRSRLKKEITQLKDKFDKGGLR